MDNGVQSSQDLFLLASFIDRCYVDRVWVRAYPLDFVGIGPKRWSEIRRSGDLEKLSERAWRVYRTLNCIKIYLKRGVSHDEIGPDMCMKLEHGEKDFFWFGYLSKDRSFYLGDVGKFSVDSILSLKINYFMTSYGMDKAIYYQVSPWLKVHVYPQLVKFRPHMVKLFMNFLIFARNVLGFKADEYESLSENWVDPYVVDPVKIREVQRELFNVIPSIVENVWGIWFGDINETVFRGLAIKVGHVEFSLDNYLDKVGLILASKYIGGSSKTIKSGGPKTLSSFGMDFGVKYYVTLKKSFQLKVYSKAINKKHNKLLNRLEITVNVNKFYYTIRDIFREIDRGETRSVLSVMTKHLGRPNDLYEFIRGLIPENERDNPLYYSFLLDLLVVGSVKASRLYRNVARYYVNRGMVSVQGRGSSTYYVLTPEYVALRDTVREKWGLVFKLIELSGETDGIHGGGSSGGDWD